MIKNLKVTFTHSTVEKKNKKNFTVFNFLPIDLLLSLLYCEVYTMRRPDNALHVIVPL